MKKLRVALVGASGKMGQELNELISNSSVFTVTALVDIKSKNTTATVIELKEIDSEQVDVVIDFSSPESTLSALKWAQKNKIPFLSGTTGLNDSIKKQMQVASESIPVLWSSNMSLGIAVLREAMRTFEKIKDYDFQIEEIHHSRKKDSPSGTALTLQKGLEQVIRKKIPAALSIRGGGVFGTHRVYALGEEEVILFEHQALNRKVFARGALVGAQWLVDQKPGMYEISNALGVKS